MLNFYLTVYVQMLIKNLYFFYNLCMIYYI